MIRRHSLIWLNPDCADEGVVGTWMDSGNPFIACRTRPGEQLSLGFCLPPLKDGGSPRQVAHAARQDQIATIQRPPLVSECLFAIPSPLHPALEKLSQICTLRLIGSRMWEALMGVSYTRPASDLDLVIDLPRGVSPEPLLADLARLATSTALAVDAEFSIEGLGEFHWREWISEAPEVLVKTLSAPKLLSRSALSRAFEAP